MTDVRTAPRASRAASAILLLAGGGAAIATAVAPTSSALRGLAVAAVAASLLTVVLGIDAVRSRSVVRALVTAATLVALGQLLASFGPGIAATCVPVTGAAVLVWASLAWGPGAAAQLAVPAAVAAATTWVNGDPAVPAVALAVLPAAAVLAELLAWPIARSTRTKRVADTAMADIDSLLVAAIDLRGVDEVGAAGDRICRLGTELLRGDGALLYVQGPGRLLLAGSHGSHPAPLDPELGRDAAIAEALRVGAVRPGEPVLIPVTGAAGVIGVLAVSGARREVDGLTAGIAQLFGGQAGAVLDQLKAVESLFDAATRDPVTGVGNRRQAAAIIASLRPGDGLLVLDVDGFESLRQAKGDAAADLLLGQVGLHLRNGTRTGDAVARYGDSQFIVTLRDLKAPIDMVVGRLVESWMVASPGRTISVGGALHLDSDAPLDTVGRAESALASAQRRGGGRGHVAPDFSVFAA